MATFLSGLVSVLLWIPFGIAGWVGYGIDLLAQRNPSIKEPGIVFSVKQAEALGLSAIPTFQDIMEELQPGAVRLIAYWDRIEENQGVYDFSELDALMGIAEKHGAKVILVIGEKVPRWPECHVPPWARALSSSAQQERLEQYLGAVVRRYAPSPALEYWQAENELFFKFGDCPKPSTKQLVRELNLVRSLDAQHLALMTGSGEMSTWLRPFWYGDAVGISLYREAVFRTQWFSLRVGYPLPPLFYGYKARFMSWVFKKPLMVTELQLEPWFTKDLKEIPLAEQTATLPLDAFQRTIAYAARTRVPRIYLWGVEWWYWLRQQGVSGYWDYAQQSVF